MITKGSKASCSFIQGISGNRNVGYMGICVNAQLVYSFQGIYSCRMSNNGRFVMKEQPTKCRLKTL